LGANLGKWQLEADREAWFMSAKEYVKNLIRIVKDMLAKEGKTLPGGKKASRPTTKDYHPELDVSPELGTEGTARYQQLIGMLRWAAELG